MFLLIESGRAFSSPLQKRPVLLSRGRSCAACRRSNPHAACCRHLIKPRVPHCAVNGDWEETETEIYEWVAHPQLPVPEARLLKQHVLVMDFVGADGFPAPRLKDARLSGSRMRALYATGWMHQSVVSLKRHALVTSSSARIYASPDNGAALVAVAERNALMELQSCPAQWCKVAAGDLRGWVARTSIWGLLDGEILD